MRAETFVGLALKVAMQNNGHFVDVILVYNTKASICRHIAKLDAHTTHSECFGIKTTHVDM
jgi:hypothetical protein